MFGGSTTKPGALLASPVFIGSVALLLINDHLLKPAWSGWVTGKLSDVAGVAMIGILASALIRRVDVALAATAIVFTLLKTVPVVAVWAAPVLGGPTRTDPSDLIALVVLFPVGRWAARRTAGGATPHDWRLPLQVLAVGAAVVATTATSCSEEGVLGVAVEVERVLATTTSGAVYESRDGGVTWSDTGTEQWEDRFAGLEFREDTSCRDDGICFEIVPPAGSGEPWRIEEAVGDTRTVILVADRTAMSAMSDLAPPRCGDGSFGAIAAVHRSDGPHVFVAMGETGLLHWRPGVEWEWIAVGEYGYASDLADERPLGIAIATTVPDDPWAGVPSHLATVGLLLVGPAVAAATVPIRRASRRNGRNHAAATAFGVAAALTLSGLALIGWFFTTVFGDVQHRQRVVTAIALWTAAGLVTTVLHLWHRRARPPAAWSPPSASRRVG